MFGIGTVEIAVLAIIFFVALIFLIIKVLSTEKTFFQLIFSPFEFVIKIGILISMAGSIYFVYLVFTQNINVINIYEIAFNQNTSKLINHLVEAKTNSQYFWPSFPVILLLLMLALFIIKVITSSGNNNSYNPQKRSSENTPKTRVNISENRKTRKAKVSNDWVVFAVLCHLSSLVGLSIIVPLIILLLKGNDSDYVNYHSKEALNFQISQLFYGIIIFAIYFLVAGSTFVGLFSGSGAVMGLSMIVLFVFYFIVIIYFIYLFIIALIATLRSSSGVYFRYPFIIRLLR